MKPSEATTQKVIQALSEYYENNPNVELLEQINMMELKLLNIYLKTSEKVINLGEKNSKNY